METKRRSPLQWLRDLFRSKKSLHANASQRVCTPITPPVQVPSPNSGLTDAEKSMIYRATRRAGTWYVCAQGHPYLVTECGTPVMMATCPTCGGVIGGKYRHYIGSNRPGRSFFATKGVV